MSVETDLTRVIAETLRHFQETIDALEQQARRFILVQPKDGGPVDAEHVTAVVEGGRELRGINQRLRACKRPAVGKFIKPEETR